MAAYKSLAALAQDELLQDLDRANELDLQARAIRLEAEELRARAQHKQAVQRRAALGPDAIRAEAAASFRSALAAEAALRQGAHGGAALGHAPSAAPADGAATLAQDPGAAAARERRRQDNERSSREAEARWRAIAEREARAKALFAKALRRDASSAAPAREAELQRLEAAHASEEALRLAARRGSPPQGSPAADRAPGPSRRHPARPAPAEPGQAPADEVVELLSSEDDEAPADEAGEEEEEEEEEDYAGSEYSEDDWGLSEAIAATSVRDEGLIRLSAKAMAAARAALGPGQEREVLVTHLNSGIDMTRKLIRCLRPSGWLNDEVMNLYMGLLQDRDTLWRKLGGGQPTCHFFNSFFINKLYKDARKYSYSNVRRWTSAKRLAGVGQASECILDLERWIIPVHLGNHWTCALVDLSARSLTYYDSYHSEERDIMASLRTYVRDEYKDKRQQDVDTLLWPISYPKDIPRQHNAVDCGVFALMFADRAARNAPMRFSEADMPLLRLKLAAEIAAAKIA
ncbi:hypothetical protein WJX81_005972 [Elliptochloris bilobata]|uniref:Ubiquitin-like protease family profile domain-containing protein n=1 Tax=Elliptochloris bilobata TaxID=381761 RepID=A0AAW1SK63_9CHLO